MSTLTSSSMNFKPRIINHFLILPQLVQSCFESISSVTQNNIIRQTIPTIYNQSVNEYFRKSNFAQPFCNLTSFPLVFELHILLTEGIMASSFFTKQNLMYFDLSSTLPHFHSIYTVFQKTAPLRQVGINSVIFQIQKHPKYTFCREYHSV